MRSNTGKAESPATRAAGTPLRSAFTLAATTAVCGKQPVIPLADVQNLHPQRPILGHEQTSLSVSNDPSHVALWIYDGPLLRFLVGDAHQAEGIGPMA